MKNIIRINGRKVNLDQLPSAEEAKPIKREESFDGCNSLAVINLPGDIFVQPSPDQTIYVEVEGREEQVKAVRMQSLSGQLTVSCEEEAPVTTFGVGLQKGKFGIKQNIVGGILGGFGCVVHNYGGSQTVISGPADVCVNGNRIQCQAGQVVAFGDGVVDIDAPSRNRLNVVIKIPRSTKIRYVGAASSVCGLDDTESDLDVEIPLSGIVMAGVVKNLRVQIYGSGNVSVQQVDGEEVELAVQGSGGIIIKKGKTRTLRARATGSGDIRAMITAQDANLQVMGSGDIKVSQVTGQLLQRCTGSGDISIYSR